MAKNKKTKQNSPKADLADDFTADLIRQLNKENGEKIAFNLSTDDAPTNIKRWISTGSRQLDCLISNQKFGGFPEGRIVEVQGPTSCHAAGDKVVLYSGKTIAVEKVKKGDKLLGPDGTPRTVLECHSGKDKMYEVKPLRGGKTYTVNQHHILTLKRAKGFSKNENSPLCKTGEIINLSINEYQKKSKQFKKMYRLNRATIEEFSGQPEKLKNIKLPIPPYILGLLLGDGSLSKKRIELTTEDKEICDSYSKFIEASGYKISTHYKQGSKAIGLYHKINTFPGKSYNNTDNLAQDKIRNSLRSLELLDTTSGTKFIPDIYKFSNIKDRLELIAGLIDTDGYHNKNNFDFVTKSKTLADDMAFVCSSVGLRVSTSDKFVETNNGEMSYKRLTISGPVETVPTRLPRKKARAYKRIKENNSLTGIKVSYKGNGNFYGFSLDKDNLYLTDDFSIYHNSGKSHICFESAKATQKMGGIVVYIDTENATSLTNLESIGINVNKRFVFCQTACTEEIFGIAESTILKARAMAKDVPVTIIWDSIAASSPKAELEGDYEKNTIGLQARTLGKGMRKIANIIGNQNVLFLLVNQQRQKIGVVFGDACVDPDTKITIRKKI